ncbi:MAG: MFS transporter [Deltaproteobacteria bacterium]|nr:MFS transporter [Deltaproteobacteria bacterium]
MSPVIKTDRVPTLGLIAFALPAFISSLMKGPTASILPTIYAKYHGIDLAAIGTILMVTRMLDAVTDPAIGYLSDRTESPIGRRKPWIIAGYALTLLVIYFLFIPPEKITAFFFLFWFAILYLAWTMAEIPYMAWQAELSHDYKQRTRIVTYRTVMFTLGGMAFAAFPLLPIFETSEFTPAVLRILAYAILIGLPITVFIAVAFAPEGKRVARRKTQSFFVMVKAIPKNKPMLSFVAIQILFGLAAGMQSSVLFLWIDTYLLIGDKFALALVIVNIVSLGGLPLWLKIINWIGKHRAWLVLQIGYIIVLPFFAFLEPGPQSFIPFMVLYITIAIVIIGGDIMPNAIIGDIIDYDTLKSGQNRAGQYSSILTLIMKANAAVGVGLGFFIVGKMGYDATATTHSAGAAAGLLTSLIWAPLILTTIATFFVWRFPLNERKQSIIKRRIESLAARAALSLEQEE